MKIIKDKKFMFCLHVKSIKLNIKNDLIYYYKKTNLILKFAKNLILYNFFVLQDNILFQGVKFNTLLDKNKYNI